jgi:hypothetical protein
MKNCSLIYILFSILFSTSLKAQLDSTYLFHDINRIHRQKIEMQVLGGWSIANIATSLALGNSATGEDIYFNQMNVAWNVFNISIASIGYLNALKEKPSVMAMDVFQRQLKLEKSLLLNTGLDVAYIFGGLWMLERAKTFENPKEFDRLRGFGRSLILQGSFLFLFDLSLYIIEASHASKLKEAMSLFFMRRGQLGMNISF